jgi:hypothetical protein
MDSQPICSPTSIPFWLGVIQLVSMGLHLLAAYRASQTPSQ